MEAQNHYYGHSAALARYVGLDRPRHVAGLVQHGWAAASPLATHFRDFPRLGTPEGGPRRLLVWSHTSRGWDPEQERRRTTAIGAPFVHLVRAAGAAPGPRDERDAVVLMPVHGIQTQRLRGDHAGLARRWREQEGAATACLYASDARDPEIVGAYRAAGHRLVVLGERSDPAFLWRLRTMLGRARRVVSNRLSTPVVYALHLGADVGVYGDPLAIDGERRGDNDRVRDLWPELHGERLDRDVARALADQELGVQHVLAPDALLRVLGWDRPPVRRVGPAVDFWTRSPASRALTTVRRRAAAPDGAPAPSAPASPAEPLVPAAAPELGWAAWLRGAVSYLPTPLPRTVPAADELVEPLPVP